MKKILGITMVLAVVTPLVGFAATTTIGGLFALIIQVINGIMPIIVALAVLYFIWGVFQFVSSAGEEDKRAEGRSRMIYGVIGIFVMVSVWGIVRLLDNSIGLDDNPIPPVEFPFDSNPPY